MVGAGRVVRTVTVLVAGSTLVTVGSMATVAARPVQLTAAALSSTQFAGYQVDKPKTGLNSAVVTFTVPAITCKKNLSGVGPAVIIESTVDKKTNSFTYSGGGIGVACVHKTPVYVALIVVNGDTINDPSVTVSAGDSITVDASMVKAKTKVTLTDHTSKTGDTKTGKGATGLLAQVGNRVLSAGRTLALDPFTRTSYTGVEINGKSLTAEKAVRYTWKHKKTVLVTASGLTKGKDFTDSFKNS